MSVAPNSMPTNQPTCLDINFLLTEDEKLAILWLWENRQELERRYREEDIIFDFPQYGNMPKSLSNKLTSWIVDWVQDKVQTGFSENREDFLHQAIIRQIT